jgi:hypothetical protein
MAGPSMGWGKDGSILSDRPSSAGRVEITRGDVQVSNVVRLANVRTARQDWSRRELARFHRAANLLRDLPAPCLVTRELAASLWRRRGFASLTLANWF